MPPRPMLPNLPRGASDILPWQTGMSSTGQYAQPTRRVADNGGLSIVRRRGPDGRVRDYWSDGQEVTDDDFAGFGAYTGRLGDENARRWDLGYGLQEDQFELDREIRRAQIEHARSQLEENRRQFDETHALSRDEFGLNILKTGASMRGPLDYFQGQGFAQGVRDANYSPYLQSIRSGTAGNYGGGTATGASPTPLTVGTMATHLAGANQAQPAPVAGVARPAGGATMSISPVRNAMTDPHGRGGATAPAAGASMAVQSGGGVTDAYGRSLTPEAAAYLEPIRQRYEGGLANTGLGFLENMTAGQRAAFKSGGDYLGRATDDEFEFYQRSRPGQRQASLA